MKSILDEINSVYNFHSNGPYIVTTGKNLCIFLKNGTCIAQRKDLRNVYHVAFLCDERILVDCGSVKDFLIVSLRNGKNVIHISRPKMDYIAPKLIVSADRNFVYSCFFLKTLCHIIKFDIENSTTFSFPLSPGLRATNDIALDAKGNLCILQCQCDRISGHETSCEGIRYELFDSFEGYGNAVNWKAKWTFVRPRRSEAFWENAESVVTNDLHVYNPNTGAIFDLLENDNVDRDSLNTTRFCGEDESKRYVLLNNNDEENIIIDKKERRIVARYNSGFNTGCIVGDSYWLYTEEGFTIKPFPLIEEKRTKSPRLTTMW